VLPFFFYIIKIIISSFIPKLEIYFAEFLQYNLPNVLVYSTKKLVLDLSTVLNF